MDEVAAPASQLTLGNQIWRLTELRDDPQQVHSGVAPVEANDDLPDYTADWSEPSSVTGPVSTGTETGDIEATPLERTLWGLLTNSSLQFDKRRFISQSSFNLSLSGSSPAYLEREQEPIETSAAAPESPGRWSLWGRAP